MGNSVKERFYEVMEILNLTDYRVYTDIEGITKNMMVKLRNGETSEVSTKILMPFLNTYKNVNANYILTGRGNAIIEDEDTDGVSPNMPTTPTITSIPTTNKDIKILDIRVCAGQGIGFDGDENEIIGYVNIPEFAGCYGITVYGDSMYDMYMSGDTIFVREIKDKHNIDNGQPYVIITKEDRLLKMITNGKEQYYPPIIMRPILMGKENIPIWKLI